MTQIPSSFLVDTDIFIDYLNGIFSAKQLLDSIQSKVYYSAVTEKELFQKQGLSSTERRRIMNLVSKHRLIPMDNEIAEKFSRLMVKYASQNIRKADALIAATCWAKKLALATRNVKHYRFIKEIRLLEITKS
jgi:predicted nucleic acid-binding protein